MANNIFYWGGSDLGRNFFSSGAFMYGYLVIDKNDTDKNVNFDKKLLK
jgi:hypothetical protein